MLFSKRVICSILPEVDFDGGLVALLDVYVLGWERVRNSTNQYTASSSILTAMSL